MSDPEGYLEKRETATIRVQRLVLWLFSGVLLAAFPIYTEVFRGIHVGQISLVSVLSKGEQFVIGGALTLGGMSEVLAARFPPKDKTWAIIAGMLALCVGLANLLAYIYIPAAGSIVVVSIWLGATALVSSAVCIAMAAGR